MEIFADTADVSEIAKWLRRGVIDGVTTRVVEDRLYLNRVLEERTSDYYAQDKCGNVWYFGEDTATVENGTIKSTEGTWHAGVKGARPGLFMPAHPRVGEEHYQEYYVGHAEDQYRVESLGGRMTVPYRRFTGVMRTGEFTRLEPGKPDHKYWARGVGQIAEVSGDRSERLKLVRIVDP